jgi:hypothetical protein
MRFEIKMAQNEEKWKRKEKKLWDLKLRWLKMKKIEKEKKKKLRDLKLGGVKRIFVFWKICFASKNTYFLYCYFGWFFSFAFERWFVELEKVLLYNISLKMKKNWERSAKVLNRRQAIGDGPV